MEHLIATTRHDSTHVLTAKVRPVAMPSEGCRKSLTYKSRTKHINDPARNCTVFVRWPQSSGTSQHHIPHCSLYEILFCDVYCLANAANIHNIKLHISTAGCSTYGLLNGSTGLFKLEAKLEGPDKTKSSILIQFINGSERTLTKGMIRSGMNFGKLFSL